MNLFRRFSEFWCSNRRKTFCKHFCSIHEQLKQSSCSSGFIPSFVRNWALYLNEYIDSDNLLKSIQHERCGFWTLNAKEKHGNHRTESWSLFSFCISSHVRWATRRFPGNYQIPFQPIRALLEAMANGRVS